MPTPNIFTLTNTNLEANVSRLGELSSVGVKVQEDAPDTVRVTYDVPRYADHLRIEQVNL